MIVTEWRARAGPALRWIAGAREELLARVPAEVARYTALGALLVGTAAIAAVSMWLALRQVTDAGWFLSPVLVLPALGWGLFILVVDRALITGVTTSRWRRTSTLVVRLTVAGVLGFVIAEPLVLQVFDSAIEARINTVRAIEEDDLRAGLLRCNPVPGTPEALVPLPQCEGLLLAVGTSAGAQSDELAGLRETAEELQGAVTADATALLELEETARRECAGEPGDGLSGRVGEGPLCAEARQVAAAFAGANPVGPRQEELGRLRARIAELEGSNSESRAAFEAERNALVDQRVAELVADRPAIGLLERLDALDALTREQAGLWFREWFLRIFLVVVDCLPVLVKFLGGVTAYDRMSERETDRDRDVHATDVDSDQRIRTARARAETELETERIDADLRRRRADRLAEETAQINARRAEYEQKFDRHTPRSTRPRGGKLEEEVIRVLATAAAGALVRAMGTKAWSAVRERWVPVLARTRSGGEKEAADELDASARELAASGPTADSVRVATAEWRGTLRTLLRSHPDLALDVRALLDLEDEPGQPVPNGVTQIARNNHGNMSVQSGRDTLFGGE